MGLRVALMCSGHAECFKILFRQTSLEWRADNAAALAVDASECYGRLGVSMLQQLMEQGIFDPSATSVPLIRALEIKNFEVVGFLAARAGASINTPEKPGTKSPLAVAMRVRNRPLIHVIMDAGGRLSNTERKPSKVSDPPMWLLFQQRRECIRCARTLYGVLRYRFRVRADGFPEGYKLQKEVAQQMARYVWNHRTDTDQYLRTKRLAKKTQKIKRK